MITIAIIASILAALYIYVASENEWEVPSQPFLAILGIVAGPVLWARALWEAVEESLKGPISDAPGVIWGELRYSWDNYMFFFESDDLDA